jgi:hypothetical protein
MSIRRPLWLMPLCLVLYACPFESNVPLETGPVEPVDSSLLGYWYGIVRDGSDFFGIEALEIGQKNDSQYAITRYGKGIKGDFILPDTGYFTGFISYLKGRRFMNLEGSLMLTVPVGRKKTEIREQKIYYVTSIDRSNDTLDVRAVTEHFSTRKTFRDPADFRQLIDDMMGRKNIFDDQYSMKYRRIPKPERLFPGQ